MKILRSFGYAWKGILYCFFMEMNFKVHFILAFITIVFSIYFDLSIKEWVVVIICIVAVLALEMLNTAIEHICNRFCSSIDPQIKIIKDVAAGSVLVAAIGSACIGALIFLPKLLTVLNK